MADELHKNLRKCIVLTCRDKKSSLVHKFPSDNNKARKWIELINNKVLNDLSIESVRKRFFVCSIHFKLSDYKNVESRSLNTTAYPSKYLKSAPTSPVSSQATRTSIVHLKEHHPINSSPTLINLQAPLKVENSKPEILENFIVVDPIENIPECYSIIDFGDNQKLQESFQTISTPESSKKRTRVTASQYLKTKKIKLELSPKNKKLEPNETKVNDDVEKSSPENKLMALFELTPEQYVKINKRIAAGKSPLDLLADNDDDTTTAMQGSYVELSLKNGAVQIDLFWLRDHCRCELCYNNVTFQRKVSILDISDNIKILSSTLNDQFFDVVWSDHHKSSYSVDFLTRYNSPEVKTNSLQIMWNKMIEENKQVARVEMKEYLCDEEASNLIVQSLVRFGVAFVEKCAPNQQQTEFIVRHLFPVQKTLFGEMWTFSDSLDHADTAYTKEYLGPHNDNTYFNDASGLQILHCINHCDGQGGDNFLVDGLKVCKQLENDHPDVFKRLSTTQVAAEYIEDGKHHKYSAPIINLDVNGELLQLRYNLYDRAPMIIPVNKARQFYADLKVLTKIVENEENQWRFKLNPGTVMFFDNWRVLHGRFSYTGKRTMTGCYVSRTEFQSKARHLKFID